MTNERILELLEYFIFRYQIQEDYREMKPLYMNFVEECLIKKAQTDRDVEAVFANKILSRFSDTSNSIALYEEKRYKERLYMLIG